MRHTTLLLIVVQGISSAALAQSGPALWVAPWPAEKSPADISADVFIFDNSETDIDAGFDLNIYKSDGRVRLDPADGNSARLGYDLIYLDIDTADPRLPDKLTDQSFGVAYYIGELDGWDFAVVAGAGFAGDEPYSDSDAWYGHGTLIASKKTSESTTWQLMLNYNGNRTLFPDLPLPFVEYIVKVNDNFSYTLGFPRSAVFYRPVDWFYLTADYTVPTTINAAANIIPFDHWRIYGSFNNSLWAFHPDANPDDRRMFFQQRSVETGVRWVPCEWFDATAAGGYAFGQEFSTGWDIRDTTAEIEIDDALYLRFALNLAF